MTSLERYLRLYSISISIFFISKYSQADISLWEKTSQSLIQSSAALNLKSDIDLWSPLPFPVEMSQSGAKFKIEHDLKAEGKLNLETELDFSNENDVNMCIRMHIPQFPVK